jgi:hypothetical protein
MSDDGIREDGDDDLIDNANHRWAGNKFGIIAVGRHLSTTRSQVSAMINKSPVI